MPLNNEILAYVAGLFDGEGCVNFTVAGPSRTWTLRVMIRNTDRAIIDFVQSLFGGRIEVAQHPQRPHWKPSYCWRVDWDTAVEFLVAIEPWVRIKSEQILVTKFWDAVRLRQGQRPEEGYREMIDLLVHQLGWLNRKGPRAADDIEPIQECLDTLLCSWEEMATGAGSNAVN